MCTAQRCLFNNRFSTTRPYYSDYCFQYGLAL